MSSKYQRPNDGFKNKTVLSKEIANDPDETPPKSVSVDRPPNKPPKSAGQNTNTKTKKGMSPTSALRMESQNSPQKPPMSAARRGSQNTPPKATSAGVKRASQSTPPRRVDASGTPPKSTNKRGTNGTPPNGVNRGDQNTTPTSIKESQLIKSTKKKANASSALVGKTPKSTKETNLNPKESDKTTLRGNERVLKCKFLLQDILLYVDPVNIGKCSMVCKLWKTYLSRKEQKFWYKWAQYNFDVRPGMLTGCLDDWSHGCRFLQKQVNTSKQRTVFTCVPSRWNCGIIVPNTFVPYGFDPNPDIDYMSLATAVHKLTTLLHKSQLVEAKCVADGNERDSDIEVVLMPWKGKKLPKPLDVLSMLHVSDDVIKSASDSETIHIEPDDPEDLEESFLVEDIEERDAYYEWLAKIFKTSFSFQAGEDVLSHRMHFFLTRINSEYIGGLIAATT
ncbi:unnamed protein product [Owenia fusiformis]|uniref:Uncharacterized protein n=1 Tax=Owenia fusiformis TaxID=6347 RepID=A0A8J1UUI4_OWEFU|nr:unnamed protein product [Owenia fusiformis]